MQNSNRKSEWVKISVWLVLAGLFVLFFWITCLKNIVSSDEPEDDESGITPIGNTKGAEGPFPAPYTTAEY